MLDYDGIIADDIELVARTGYTIARLSVNAAFYVAAAAMFTIADQMLALFETDDIY